MNLNQLQEEVGRWSRKNFGDQPDYYPLLGAVEEIGELCHSYLKSKQGIRGTEKELQEKKIDAVADVIIYLADFCERSGIDLADCVNLTWNKVKDRDWKNNPDSGASESL